MLHSGRASAAVASSSPRGAGIVAQGMGSPLPPTSQQRATIWDQRHERPPGWAWGYWQRPGCWSLCCAALCPVAHRCMCSSGHTWMSSCSAWASSLSACSSLPAWPRWVPPAPAIAFPFPATSRVAQFPSPACPWALLAPCPPPTPLPACPCKALARETEARGKLALVESWVPSSPWGGHSGRMCPSDPSHLLAVCGPRGRPAG